MKKAIHILLGGLVTLFSSDLMAADSMVAARKLLMQAIGDAGKRLQRTECGAFFGPGALDTLTSADYRILSAGAPRFKGNQPTVTGAFTIREARMVVINLDGPFVNPRILLAGRYHYFNAIASAKDDQTVLPDSEFRALMLLHELGHLMGKFGPDTKNVEQSDANNRAVLRQCF